MKKKNVAILLATYNGEKYLKQQIDSIINQTYKNIIIYIHDDGSTDNTLLILNEYADKYPEIIKLLNYDKTGSAKNNFLSLLSRVDEEYIMFSDQDDYWLKDKIKLSIDTMLLAEEKDKNLPICVYTDMHVVDENLEVLYDSFLKSTKKNGLKNDICDLLSDNSVAGCTCLINKKCCELANNYLDINNIKMHDWWVALIAKYCGKLIFLNEKTSLYRQHSNNVVGIHNNKIKWMKRILKNIISGKQFKSSYDGIKDILNISKELDRFNAINENDKTAIRKLSNINEYSKYSRMIFFFKNNLIKKDLKNIWKIFLV